MHYASNGTNSKDPATVEFPESIDQMLLASPLPKMLCKNLPPVRRELNFQSRQRDQDLQTYQERFEKRDWSPEQSDRPDFDSNHTNLSERKFLPPRREPEEPFRKNRDLEREYDFYRTPTRESRERDQPRDSPDQWPERSPMPYLRDDRRKQLNRNEGLRPEYRPGSRDYQEMERFEERRSGWPYSESPRRFYSPRDDYPDGGNSFSYNQIRTPKPVYSSPFSNSPLPRSKEFEYPQSPHGDDDSSPLRRPREDPRYNYGRTPDREYSTPLRAYSLKKEREELLQSYEASFGRSEEPRLYKIPSRDFSRDPYRRDASPLRDSARHSTEPFGRRDEPQTPQRHLRPPSTREYPVEYDNYHKSPRPTPQYSTDRMPSPRPLQHQHLSPERRSSTLLPERKPPQESYIGFTRFPPREEHQQTNPIISEKPPPDPSQANDSDYTHVPPPRDRILPQQSISSGDRPNKPLQTEEPLQKPPENKKTEENSAQAEPKEREPQQAAQIETVTKPVVEIETVPVESHPPEIIPRDSEALMPLPAVRENGSQEKTQEPSVQLKEDEPAPQTPQKKPEESIEPPVEIPPPTQELPKNIEESIELPMETPSSTKELPKNIEEPIEPPVELPPPTKELPKNIEEPPASQTSEAEATPDSKASKLPEDKLPEDTEIPPIENHENSVDPATEAPTFELVLRDNSDDEDDAHESPELPPRPAKIRAKAPAKPSRAKKAPVRKSQRLAGTNPEEAPEEESESPKKQEKAKKPKTSKKTPETAKKTPEKPPKPSPKQKQPAKETTPEAPEQKPKQPAKKKPYITMNFYTHPEEILEKKRERKPPSPFWKSPLSLEDSASAREGINKSSPTVLSSPRPQKKQKTTPKITLLNSPRAPAKKQTAKPKTKTASIKKSPPKKAPAPRAKKTQTVEKQTAQKRKASAPPDESPPPKRRKTKGNDIKGKEKKGKGKVVDSEDDMDSDEEEILKKGKEKKSKRVSEKSRDVSGDESVSEEIVKKKGREKKPIKSVSGKSRDDESVSEEIGKKGKGKRRSTRVSRKSTSTSESFSEEIPKKGKGKKPVRRVSKKNRDDDAEKTPKKGKEKLLRRAPQGSEEDESISGEVEWTDEERKQLHAAWKKVPATTKLFWQAVAMQMEGKSARQCQEEHQRKYEKDAEKKAKQKEAALKKKAMNQKPSSPIKLTKNATIAKTAKNKRKIREWHEKKQEGHIDDPFESSDEDKDDDDDEESIPIIIEKKKPAPASVASPGPVYGNTKTADREKYAQRFIKSKAAPRKQPVQAPQPKKRKIGTQNERLTVAKLTAKAQKKQAKERDEDDMVADGQELDYYGESESEETSTVY